jgi:hypothetical protein
MRIALLSVFRVVSVSFIMGVGIIDEVRGIAVVSDG